ncbi:sulfotransferase [Christiangramia sp. SM2212]|uniref:Sulfotransferase n=1 Tax=Christiangramia sediminicola TaxID=3073267 RepID=A0ABU1EMW5_9FLAO|nr:sulfotransferase [Christiangramia sp. SM2212]MDR5589686.1 sulfotransferase [Christiangramia sp. SM2212]
MKTEDQKIIFLNSYLPRTGHNFSSQAIKVFSDHQVLSHPHSETRLSNILASYYKIFDNTINHKVDKDFMDLLFINKLRNNILKESKKEYVMIKDTSVIGVKDLKRTFPDDIHLILIRDPKNVFNSLIKGMSLKKKSIKSYLKKVGNKTGLYPWFYSNKLSTKVLKEIPDLSQYLTIRYEDLVQKDEKLLWKLKQLFHSKKSLEQIKKEIDEIKVLNSSFFEEVGGEKIWDHKLKTKNFDPINRKSNTWLIRKGIEIGSRKLRKKLNYI